MNENVAGSYQETFLYLNGVYMAYFTTVGNNNNNNRLTVLIENVLYGSTDGRGIKFRIVNGELTYPLHPACN